MRILPSLILIMLLSGNLSFSENSKIELFPKGNYFNPILLDPATPQLSSSVYAYVQNGIIRRKAYIPVNIGASKIILRREKNKDVGFEAGVEFAIHSQFIIGPVRNSTMGGLQNADYRISGIGHYKNGRNVYRIKVFHQSSHLGDDHIIRNEITTPTSNIQNYEEISLMMSRYTGNIRYYISGGYNFSFYTIRKRILLHGGTYYSRPVNIKNGIGLIGGFDLKIYEQNNFTPNWKVGIGIEIGQNKTNSIKMLLEYYNGNLPYSTLEPEKVQLFGMGFYFNPPVPGKR